METRKLLKLFEKMLPIIFLIAFAAIGRILPHPPNFTPLGGIALFSGTYLTGISSFILPLLIMFISDIVLGFHSTMLYVYGSFLLIVLVGKFLRGKISFFKLVGTSLLSSVLFFVITNFGVWANTNIYSKDVGGLVQSYIMGIPFFKNTILGDLFYSLVLFYGFQFITTVSYRLFFLYLARKKST